MKKEISLIIVMTFFVSSALFAQNSPFLIWGTGLDGSTYQTTAIYSQSPNGLTIEAPKDASGNKLPIKFNWRGGGTYPFYIDANSNIGIGTNSPTAKLQVTDLNGDNSSVGIARFYNQQAISDNKQTSIFIGQSQGRGLCGVFGYYSYPNSTSDAGLFLVNYGDNEKTSSIYIKKGGFVGIGTATPDYKLDVIGTIRAREIKVDLNGADFVFESGYKLRTLEEVESFVKENKHLPEIEPANKMETNGAELGELNSKLLQKIEELTLYMIEINTRMKTVEKENSELKEKVAKLESVQ